MSTSKKNDTSTVNDVMSSLPFPQSYDVVMQEIINIIKSFSCRGGDEKIGFFSGIKRLIGSLLSGMPKIILIFVIKHYMANPADIIAMIKKIAWSFFKATIYRSKVYDKAKTQNIDLDDFKSQSLIPYYFEFSVNDVEVSWIPGLHDKNIKLIDKKIKESNEKRTTYITGCTKLKMESNKFYYEKFEKSSLFPAKNFMKLTSIIEKYVKVCYRTSSFSTLGILVDGKPGLGKTKFSEYLASKNIMKMVRKIDMTEFLKSNFDLVCNKGYSFQPIDGPTLFVIDEIDKYIDYRVNDTYDTYIKECTKNKTDAIKKEEHIKKEKTDFLYNLLSVLERDGLQHPCIVMFCSNNFDTIFSELDNTHFESLKSRFMKVPFYECDNVELIQYLNYLNDKFIDSEFYVEKEVFNKAIGKLGYVSIPYRKLHQITVMAGYDIPKIVDGIIEEMNKIFPTKDQVNEIINDKEIMKNEEVAQTELDTPKQKVADNQSIIIEEEVVDDEVNDAGFAYFKCGGCNEMISEANLTCEKCDRGTCAECDNWKKVDYYSGERICEDCLKLNYCEYGLLPGKDLEDGEHCGEKPISSTGLINYPPFIVCKEHYEKVKKYLHFCYGFGLGGTGLYCSDEGKHKIEDKYFCDKCFKKISCHVFNCKEKVSHFINSHKYSCEKHSSPTFDDRTDASELKNIIDANLDNIDFCETKQGKLTSLKNMLNILSKGYNSWIIREDKDFKDYILGRINNFQKQYYPDKSEFIEIVKSLIPTGFVEIRELFI